MPTKTWSAVSRQLFGFIGTTGDIPFTVTYPDSTIQYQLLVPVNKWLRDKEEPSPLRELGIQPPFQLESLSLAAVSEEGAGYRAGLRAGDRLLAINGVDITSINSFIDTVASSAGVTVVLLVERDAGQQLSIQAIPQLVARDGEMLGQLGVQLSSKGRYPETLLRNIEHGFFGALARATGETVETSFFVLESIGKLIVGDLSPKNLSGPITIAKVAGDTAKSGIDNFIRFIAILSIMLGVMNLLPIPVLDGGHLLYYLIEVVKGSPVSDRVQLAGYKIGFFMLIGLMVFATYNDLMRSF